MLLGRKGIAVCQDLLGSSLHSIICFKNTALYGIASVMLIAEHTFNTFKSVLVELCAIIINNATAFIQYQYFTVLFVSFLEKPNLMPSEPTSSIMKHVF